MARPGSLDLRHVAGGEGAADIGPDHACRRSRMDLSGQALQHGRTRAAPARDGPASLCLTGEASPGQIRWTIVRSGRGGGRGPNLRRTAFGVRAGGGGAGRAGLRARGAGVGGVGGPPAPAGGRSPGGGGCGWVPGGPPGGGFRGGGSPPPGVWGGVGRGGRPGGGRGPGAGGGGPGGPARGGCTRTLRLRGIREGSSLPGFGMREGGGEALPGGGFDQEGTELRQRRHAVVQADLLRHPAAFDAEHAWVP